MINGIVFLLILAGGAALIVWYLKAFYAERAEREKKAEAHRQKHGGEHILEWSGPFADGAPDGKFGKLVVEIPKKRGGGAARRGFTKKGWSSTKNVCPIRRSKISCWLPRPRTKSSL